MRRLAPLPTVILVAALIGLATADASTTKTVVRSANTKLGRIIVAGSNRHTLYGFTKDQGTKKSHCYKACSKTWIPFLAKGRVVAARHSHVNARKLGKIRRRNGSHQVTYYGQPLYLYKRDTKPGQTKGHYKYQFGGSWYAIDVNGSPAPPPGY